MKRLIDRWLSKKEYKSTTERMLMRQCLMTAFFLITGLATTTVSTWALFSQEVSVGSFEVEIAEYELQIEKEGNELDDTTTYVTSGDRTRFTLTAKGTATTGYCTVVIDGEEYVTEQIKPGDSLDFYIKVRDTDVEDEEEIEKATDSEADEVEPEEYEVEVFFLSEWGKSPLADSMVSRMRLSDEEKEELEELLISDGETILCGEEVETTVVKKAETAKIPETTAVTAGNTSAMPGDISGTVTDTAVTSGTAKESTGTAEGTTADVKESTETVEGTAAVPEKTTEAEKETEEVKTTKSSNIAATESKTIVSESESKKNPEVKSEGSDNDSVKETDAKKQTAAEESSVDTGVMTAFDSMDTETESQPSAETKASEEQEAQ